MRGDDGLDAENQIGFVEQGFHVRSDAAMERVRARLAPVPAAADRPYPEIPYPEAPYPHSRAAGRPAE